MAEALAAVGVASNMVQFITLAYTVANRTSSFCASTKDAPEVFRSLSIQLPLIIDICNRYRALPQQEDSAALEDVLDQCTNQTRELQELLGKMLPMPADSFATKAWKATKSVMLEKKVQQYSTKLETFKTLISLKLGLLTYTAVTGTDTVKPKASCVYLPSGRVGSFVGRKRFLNMIDQTLKPGLDEPKVCVLIGLGGQGKTSLAFEYCRAEREKPYFNSIIWFDAMSITTVQQRFAQIADQLCEHQRTFANPEACISYVKATLQNWSAPWLIVFDNYDRVEKFQGLLKYIPAARDGAVLITSRHSGCAGLGTPIYLTGLDEPEAVNLLVERAQVQPTEKNLADSKKVVELLGYLPLAIDQSAAYIRSRRISLKEFISHYKKRKDRVIAYKPPISDYLKIIGDDPQDSSEPEPLSVWTSWEMSFDQLSNSNLGLDVESICHFLTSLAFFSNTEIKMNIFETYWEESLPESPAWMDIFVDSDGDWDAYAYQDAVSCLEQLSLINYQDEIAQKLGGQDETETSPISLHPLVRDWIQLRLSPSNRRRHSIESMRILWVCVKAATKGDSWPLTMRQDILAHLDATLGFQSQHIKNWDDVGFDDLEQYFGSFVSFYTDHGRYTEAEEICHELLAKQKSKHGNFGEQTLLTEIHLSEINLLQGKYKEVETHFLGFQDLISPQSSVSFEIRAKLQRNLAHSYFKQGRYEEATEHFSNVLAEQIVQLGEKSTDVLDTKEALAQIYRNQGNHSQATSLYKTVLEGYRMSQPDNVKSWRCMVNLANNYRAQSLDDQAAELYERAWKGMTASLGEDHPSTLSTRLFLAINLLAMGRYDSAEPIFQ